MSAVSIVVLPVPVFVGASLYRRLGPQLTREPKTFSRWPLPSRAIPDRKAVDAMLDQARRDLSERRAQRLLQELERAS
jgi:hypothetical protein